MAATMSPIDALNAFGRDAQTGSPVKQDFDLEEDEEFLLGPMKPFTSPTHAGQLRVQPMAADTHSGYELGDNGRDGEDTPPPFVREDDTPPPPGRDDTPPFPGARDATPPFHTADVEATPPFRKPSPFKPFTTPNADDSNMLSEDDMEEDPAFLLSHTTTMQAEPGQGVSTESLHADIDGDLEEDPSFFRNILSAGPSSIPPSSPPMFSSPQSRQGDEDGSRVSSMAEVIAPVTEKRLDVSKVDLGRHVSTVKNARGTTFNGKTIRFKRQKGHGLVGEVTASVSRSSTSSASSSELGKLAMTMLEKPIHVLMDNIEREKDLKDKAKREETIHNNLVEAYGSKKSKGKARAGTKQSETWTDRYKPRKFTELLGDERTHRQAMSWLKEWDSCVFKTQSAASIARKKQLKRARESANAALGGIISNNSMEAEDPLGRPKDKILLLTGPPGLGKTTLAHVIATQAGYRIAEINASDDRSAKIVHNRIRQSLESTTITSLGSLSSSKPTCLIIDEIDGAAGGDAGFIKTLVKLVMDGSKISTASKSTAGKGKKKEAMPLQRPIICICNDLYVPALRPLRAIARIVRFQPPTTGMLVKRLKDICEGEKLKSDHKSLTTLVEVAEGDMRSCLNTLQIVRAQSSTLDISAIKSTALGLKDTQTSVSAVWDKLFKVPAKKRQKGIEDHTGGKYITPLVKDIITCGEYDRLAQTCFENYLKGKTPADELRACSRALEWLQFYDSLDARLRRERDYDIMPYIPYAFVAWNPLFAAVSNKTPEWPRVDFEMRTKRSAHQEVADMLSKALPMHIKSLFGAHSIVAELAPLLMRIITPDLKPVNQQLVKSEDRVALKKLIKAMLDLGISYVQDRNEEGQIVYKLDPPLDIFASFDGKRGADLPAARFNLRQVISKELEAEIVRRAGGSDGELAKGSKNMGDLMQAYKSTKGSDGPMETKSAVVALDFFGRPIAVKPTLHDMLEGDDSTTPAPPPKKRVRVFYKYHEGFSNAVRTNVKVTELFR